MLILASPPLPPPARGILKAPIQGTLAGSEENSDDDLAPPADKHDRKRKPAAGKSPQQQYRRFHVFHWLYGETEDLFTAAAVESLNVQMQEIDAFLSKDTSVIQRRVYQNCPESDRNAVYQILVLQGAEVERFQKRPQLKKDWEDRIDVFNAADVLFRFFLPSRFQGPTAGKFWGALSELLRVFSTEFPYLWATSNTKRAVREPRRRQRWCNSLPSQT
jgi:hypothetical protein